MDKNNELHMKLDWIIGRLNVIELRCDLLEDRQNTWIRRIKKLEEKLKDAMVLKV